MPMYALAILLPLIHHVNHDIDQVWYAFIPDGTSLSPLVQHMATMSMHPKHALLQNNLIILLPSLPSMTPRSLSGTAEGRPHLGAALGNSTFVQLYVK